MNYKYSTLALAIVALLTGCGAEDNKDIGDDNNIYPPIIKGEVTIPALHVGLTAQGAYQYFDPNPAARPEGNSIYSWRDAVDTELSSEQAIDLTYDLLGDSLRFCVTPVAQGTNTTVGEEACSDPRVVNEPLGEPPVADNVQLDNTTPDVGETLTGSYDYSHSDASEGNTEFTWYADDSLIAGADAITLALLASETELKAVKFCVTPITQESTPVRGDETCSLATDPVKPIAGSAPVAENTVIVGNGFVGAVLTGNYDFVDTDGDLEGTSRRVWNRDGAPIPNATATTYTAVDADENKNLTFCVTPISATGTPTDGIEACSADLLITKKIETVPVAADVAANVQSGGVAEVGETLVSSYTYSQDEGASEGDSLGNWNVGGIDQPSCTTAQGCEYPLTQADVGKIISFCVTPETLLGTPGIKACSTDVTTMGIELSGVLEYDNTLVAVVHGYDGDVNTAGNWMVDTTDQTGPAGDLTPISQGTGTTYTIGNRAAVTNDTNGNLIIDDYDWIADGSVAVDARNFVGKSVQFCLDTVSYGQKCVSAADFAEVKGGLYFDATNKTLRAIEPIREVAFGAFVYHRPLTVAEAALKADAGFGADIPNASETMTANGLDWAKFSQIVDGEKLALNSCRNLYATGGDWHLPISQFTAGSKGYISNSYAADGNIPPTGSTNSMIRLTKDLITDSDDPTFGISPVYGWPIGGTDKIPFGSASRLPDDGNFNVVRFYANGGSANNYTEAQAPLITCVKK
ncbi:MAG: hypothetical protein QNK26_13910 [Moritella sp.]|uniref:hypothetical protein n=1 Tax=Moritella sp. TaxID=78556 RepID=UPI0029AAA0CA|nr:hypothetical protein [Moritella sp.]MDX2321678.1 hypothetical protein [Moritella sp.]